MAALESRQPNSNLSCKPKTLFIQFTSLHKSHISTPHAGQVPAPRHQAHTPDRAYGAHRLSPARSVNLGAPPSRPVREHQRDCHCQRLGRLTPSELYKVNLPSYIGYEYNQSSTEQSYKYRMTYHLYRMSVLYLHARHSAIPYVHHKSHKGIPAPAGGVLARGPDSVGV